MCRRIEYANRWAAFSAWQQSQVAAPSQAALEHLGRSGALGTNPTTPKRTRSVGVQTENLGGTVMTKDFRFLAKHGFFYSYWFRLQRHDPFSAKWEGSLC